MKLGSLAYKLIIQACVVIGRLLYGLKVEGMENIPSSGACIIVLDHPGAMSRAFQVHLILARRKLETWGAFSPEIGFGSLNRIRPKRLIEGAREERRFLYDYRLPGRSTAELWKALELLHRGKAIVLAPEGEATWDGRLQPLKPGAAWLALRAHVPVVPMVTIGAYDILPRWTLWPRLRGKLTVRVGKPFYVSEGPCPRVTHEMVQEASQRIWKELAALLAKGA
ncbi:MAG: lysophospholipid acyltransferase family protein [Candidatus Methylomirabilales bacterium]